MNNIGSRKVFNNKNHILFFAIVVVLFWIKSYVVYRLEFNLGIDDGLQKVLLAINPFSSALFFFGLALLSKKHAKSIMVVIHFLLSFLLYANIVYYRFFSDFITVPVIMQGKSNAGDLGSSAVALMSPYDVLFFADFFIILALALTLFKKFEVESKKSFQMVLLFAVTVFLFNLGLAEKDRPQLLTRTFDRNYLVKYLGIPNFTLFDIVQNAESSTEKAFASSSDITDVENYRKANYTTPNPALFGKAKGMNVIYVSMESFQNFMINYKMPDGEEVTPFLNSLTHDQNTFYFDNFFHQTGQGKTSDAEFLMENSLYPMSTGAVFINKAQNTYQSAPAILDEKGYNSAVFHGNYKTFWNRNVMYKSLGYNQFFDASYYDMSSGNVKNYGMKDKPYFAESMSMLESLPQPFYTKFITLSNHFPFDMDEGDTNFPKGNTGDSIVDNYFQSAHYMDQALQQFFDSLKKDGLYDNSIIVLYGDHYGLSSNHYKAMAKVLGVDKITPTMDADLQKTPLYIHVPGVQGGIQHQYGGEVDVRPTVLHLLGVDTKDYIEFGSDLLSPQHRDWALFRNGDYVSPTMYHLSDKIYDPKTGLKIQATPESKVLDTKVRTELQMSDEVVQKDLLRFYQPPGFKPINPDDFQYLGPKDKPQKTVKTTTVPTPDTGQ